MYICIKSPLIGPPFQFFALFTKSFRSLNGTVIGGFTDSWEINVAEYAQKIITNVKENTMNIILELLVDGII